MTDGEHPMVQRLFWDGNIAPRPGWRGCDGTSAEALVTDGLPIDTGTIDELYLGPSIASVAPWEVMDVLEEARRVLRAGGHVRVAAFDTDAAVAAYVGRDADFFWDESQPDLASRFTAQLLQWGSARSLFTPDTLVRALVEAGFDDVCRQPFGVSTAPWLATADRFERHCCHVEARNTRGWPVRAASASPQGIHLAWADRRCSAVDAIWTATSASSGSVRWREVGSDAWDVTGARAALTIDGVRGPAVFRASSPPLLAGSVYEYEIEQRLGTRTVLSTTAAFRSLPSDGSPVTFAFVADTGIDGRADGLADGSTRVVEEIAARSPAFVLCGGDYAYRSSDPRLRSGQEAVHAWLEQMEPLARSCPVAMQYGNHDVSDRERHRDWAVHFPNPRPEDARCVRSFSFDAEPCHVTSFYAPTEEIDAGELLWLAEDLATARDGGCEWLIVFQHQPLFAHGAAHPSDGRVARTLGRLLSKHRVDLHLSAHDQNYERTFPLRWSAGRASAHSHASHRYRRGDGVVLAKVGPGGKRSNRGSTFSALPAARSDLVAAASDRAHHFALVEATGDSLVLRTFELPTATSRVTVIDEVVITR